jgi:hypothetical protein
VCPSMCPADPKKSPNGPSPRCAGSTALVSASLAVHWRSRGSSVLVDSRWRPSASVGIRRRHLRHRTRLRAAAAVTRPPATVGVSSTGSSCTAGPRRSWSFPRSTTCSWAVSSARARATTKRRCARPRRSWGSPDSRSPYRCSSSCTRTAVTAGGRTSTRCGASCR